MTTSVLERLRADMVSHRAELVTEEERLTRQLAEIRQAIAGIDQVLGQTKKESNGTKPESAGLSEEKDQLRKRMVEILSQILPDGLTSQELVSRIQPEWTHGELSARRVGNLAARMTELTGDGEKWYYVPAESEG